MNVLYIHGFASCGMGNKSAALRRYFGETSVFSPDLPADPEAAIALLEDSIRSVPDLLLVGSSLGGFYATVLAERHGLDAVVINPSVRPYDTLRPYVGTNRRFCDNRPFAWKADDLDKLKSMRREPKNGRYLVLLQTGDEVLDYRVALDYYKTSRVVVEYGGNHRFENLEDYICMIERFAKG